MRTEPTPNGLAPSNPSWFWTVRLGALGCGAITALLSLSRFTLQGPTSAVGWLLVAVSVALALCPLLLRTSRPRLAGIAVPAIGLVGTVGMALLESGALSEALFFLVIVPLAAAFLAGPDAALAFGVASLVGLTLIGGIAGVGSFDGATPPPELLHLIGAGGASAFATLLGWTYETERQHVDARRLTTIVEIEEARDRAEASNRAKSTFLAHMSHELRTPLNAVIGFSRLVGKRGKEVLDDTSLQYLSRIDANGVALLGLIQDILDLSKIEAGHMTLAIEPVDVGSVIEEVMASLEAPARAQGSRLVVTGTEGIDAVPADPARLRQVLVNLVGNAVKFTTDGQVEIKVSSDGGTVRVLEVRDTGIGISPETMDKLFTPFVQGEEGLDRRFSGTGLGLVISRNLCLAMGWELTLSSVVGKGTVATVHLGPGD